MIVDGTAEFVGSQSLKAREAILQAASKPKIPVTLALGNSKGPGKESFSVKVGKLKGDTKSDSAQAWLAITETGLNSAVTRGENAGKDVHPAAIVLSMRMIDAAKASEETSFAAG